MAAKKPSVSDRRQLYKMPAHMLEACGRAAHSWYTEMGPEGELVVRQLDGATKNGESARFMMSPEEAGALMRGLVQELDQLVLLYRSPQTEPKGPLLGAIETAAEALALLSLGGSRAF